MELKIINVNESNLIGIAKDPTAYVLKKLGLFDRVMMIPAGDASVEDLLSEKNLVVQIIEK